MGWYTSDKDLECATCRKKIKAGDKLYILGDNKQEHFICFWERVDKEKTNLVDLS